jgi:RNA polymerase subunit RPABC4/transcription elongation factor Spt4
VEKECKMAEKTASINKKTTNKKANKEDSIVCEVCGLSSISEEFGGIVVAEDSELLCCSKPLKGKIIKAKSPSK